MKKSLKLLFLLFGLFLILVSGLLFTYIKVLPAIVSNPKTSEKIAEYVNKNLDMILTVENPELKTELSPYIAFSVKKLQLYKQDTPLIDVENFNIILSFEEIIKKKIVLHELGADYIYANAEELSKISFGENEKKENNIKWKIDMFHSLLYVKESLIIYKPQKSDIQIKINAKNLQITETRNPKYLKFNVVVELLKGQEVFEFKFDDRNKVYFKDRTLFADNCEFFINKSKINVNFELHENQKYKLNVNSKNFSLTDLTELIKTNLIIPNGEETLAILKDIKGSFNFNVDIIDNVINGIVNLNKANFKVTIFHDLPVTLTKGIITFDTNDAKLSDIKGFYGKNVRNTLEFAGDIKDYMTRFDTDVKGMVLGTKELTTDYVTPMAGYPIELINPVDAAVIFKMNDGKMDISSTFKLIKGNDILVDKISIMPATLERAFWAQMEIIGNNFELKNLNCYIADKLNKEQANIPIIRIYGNFDILKNMAIKNLGFKFENPVPSEFLNLFLGGRIFARGQVSGFMEYIENEGIPHIKGNFNMDKVFVPSQRLSMEKFRLVADRGMIDINVNGIFRRNKYKFDGHILNEIKLPITIKEMNLHIAELNIEKILESMNRQHEREQQEKAKLVSELSVEKDAQIDEESDEQMVFVRDLIVVEDSNLTIDKGAYKNIEFGNVHAIMTLNKDGILNFYSNEFDIAGGTSSASILCDLFNQKYNMTLDVENVDSDAIATAILNLPNEIYGAATGTIALNADESLKINGKMTFNIKEGAIAKIGLVQYLLNFVSLFRNPLAMISPATIIDLVNIPEGYFDDISGTINLKDNNIRSMMIKSTAPQLSTFIIGSYNLEKSDAMLRIYTKFSNQNKGMAGVLRNFSLNAIASKVPLSRKNDASYYEAELKMIPPLQIGEKDSQVFLTKIDGDVEHNNYISSVKRIK